MRISDLLWVGTNVKNFIGQITFKLKEGFPDSKLFLVGSSGSCILDKGERSSPVNPLVISFKVPESPQKDLIVLEMLAGGNVRSHLIEVKWKKEGASSKLTVDMNKVWISDADLPSVQSFVTKDGKTGIKMVLKGKTYTTHNDSSKLKVIVCDADIICQHVAGRISDSKFIRGARAQNKGTEVKTGDVIKNNKDVKDLGEMLAKVFLIALEPLNINPFKSRILRIRKIWSDINEPISKICFSAYKHIKTR